MQTEDPEPLLVQKYGVQSNVRVVSKVETLAAATGGNATTTTLTTYGLYVGSPGLVHR